MSAALDKPGPRPASVSRRSVLAVGTVGVSGVALAACSQAKSPSTNAAGADGAASATAKSTGPAAPLAKLSDIKVGEAIAATDPDGAKIIIARPTATTVAAFSAICTHQGCAVVPAGKELDCPCHGSVYNATTGAVLNGPAPRPLPTVAVKLSGQDVLLG